MKTHLIYHRKDADGILSAAIACHFLKLTPDNSTLYGVDHPERCPLLYYSPSHGTHIDGNKVMPRDRILIVDFSYSLEETKAMMAQNDTLIIYDHHKTAIDELSHSLPTQPHWVLDTSRAACQIVWDELSGLPRPWYVDLIGWRDLGGPWQPNADPVKSWEANVINTGLFNFAPLDPYRLAEHITDNLQWIKWQEAAENLNAANQAAAKAIAQACPLQLAHFPDAGQIPIVFNVHPALQSDVCAALMAHHNYPAACVCNREISNAYSFTFSFRSTAEGPDVSALAKRFGGGGHPRAAGCTLPSLPLITQGKEKPKPSICTNLQEALKQVILCTDGEERVLLEIEDRLLHYAVQIAGGSWMRLSGTRRGIAEPMFIGGTFVDKEYRAH